MKTMGAEQEVPAEQAGREAAQEEVGDDQQSPARFFHGGTSLHQVVKLRVVAGFELLDLAAPGGEQAVESAGLVLEVAEGADPGRAGLDAGRLSARVDPMDAHRALVDDPRLLVEEAGVVRAGDDAVPTTDAVVALDRLEQAALPGAQVFALLGRSNAQHAHGAAGREQGGVMRFCHG